ncbi:MAG: 3-dehydroquinate synthase [Candidatus Latescibacteria bacterium]|nr:3-dehydroquinate synthase [Candidatus Latescibacterota bacterium]
MELIPVEFGNRSYTIEIEAGSLVRTGKFLRKCVGDQSVKVLIATTKTVAGLYLDTVREALVAEGFDVIDIIVPDGEEYKTLKTYENIVTKCIEARFERRSIIVPLGGGVIGDTAGFVAATLLRGVPFIQIPTTIVSQVDSSIGGKVAVNHSLGKNLIGSFYQPRGVLIDTKVLTTLEQREVISGMGEVVKHAVIRTAEFFTFLEEHIESIMRFEASDDVMERFIGWNCKIKAEVVSADEHESGLRAILNYGHTVGHALEAVTRYSRFKHGEAVILGMVAAGKIALDKGLMSETDFTRQNNLLNRVGISSDLTGIDIHDVLKAMTLDKKVIGGRLRFILPDSIGAVRIHNDVSDDEIKKSLSFLFNDFFAY